MKKYSKAEIFLSILEAVQRTHPIQSLGDDIISFRGYLQTGPSDEEFKKTIQEHSNIFQREDIFILIEAIHEALEAFSLGFHDTREIMTTLIQPFEKFIQSLEDDEQNPDLLHIIYGKDFEDNIESAHKMEFKFGNGEKIILFNGPLKTTLTKLNILLGSYMMEKSIKKVFFGKK